MWLIADASEEVAQEIFNHLNPRIGKKTSKKSVIKMMLFLGATAYKPRISAASFLLIIPLAPCPRAHQRKIATYPTPKTKYNLFGFDFVFASLHPYFLLSITFKFFFDFRV